MILHFYLTLILLILIGKLAQNELNMRWRNKYMQFWIDYDNDNDEEESSSSSGSESDTSRLWDLAHIFSVKELNKPEPKMCSWGDDCGLVACSKWVTEGRAPWYSCLDCQVE